MVISSFSGDFDFLSNFFPCEVAFEGMIFPSSEHAFQAAKTLSRAERRAIAVQPTPGKAKRAGRHVMLRPDWENIKLDVMEEILWIKFRDPKLRRRLCATGDQRLIEGNNWNDTFWGICNGRGQNNLGKLLMKIRWEVCNG